MKTSITCETCEYDPDNRNHIPMVGSNQPSQHHIIQTSTGKEVEDKSVGEDEELVVFRHQFVTVYNSFDVCVGYWTQNDRKCILTVVNETLRLYLHSSSLSLPHKASNDCNVSGFHVPKGATLITNIFIRYSVLLIFRQTHIKNIITVVRYIYEWSILDPNTSHHTLS
ncbi:hypothetical protein Sjap_010491 [Stephania japonica]|uniref:Uncharacterized protein n=1 Tax=Stephania japonica TaxID=461633 RepID=A0AAP0J9H8_9MAGN